MPKKITLEDISLKGYDLTDRIKTLKKEYFDAFPEICNERPRHITDFHLVEGLFEKESISVLDKARAYKYALEKRDPIIHHDRAYGKGMKPFKLAGRSLFAGSTTSKYKGVPMYPEFLGLSIWPELHSISKRESNPFQISEAEAEELNRDIFPHWMRNNITEIARQRCYEENRAERGAYKSAPEMKLMERLVFFLGTKVECISHTIPDFSRVLTVGLRGIIEEAKEKESESSDGSKWEFYAAVAEAMEGVVTYSNNLASKAEELAARESDPAVKEEFLAMAAVNRNVPEHPAQSFREGLTTIWVCWTAIHLENPNAGLSLGRLDQLLYDIYRKDTDSGAIDIQEAIELICCLWLKIGDHVPMIPETGEQLFGGTGSNQAITIGGVDREGRDAVNDLTYVMLRATELMKLRDPNLNARCYPGESSKEYLRRLCDVNIETKATPALHNDKSTISALTKHGVSLEDARDYGVIGCVEPCSSGRTYGHTGAVLLNLTSALELALFNGKHRHTGDVEIGEKTGDPRTFSTFAEFRSAFEAQARWLINETVKLNNILGRTHQSYYPTPILSALFEGPMEKGKDLIEGGAKINSSAAAIIGLADVADSLSAIEKVVYEEKSHSFDEFLDALYKNFEGYESLQKRLMNHEKTPKYGNENKSADANVAWIIELMDKVYGEKMNYRGGKYLVGYWTMTMHAGFGKLMQAMPNGRMARENFTSGITPVSAVTPYLTKALNSIADQPVDSVSSGMALNLKYTPELAEREKMLDNFVASVKGYWDDKGGTRTGGMEIQFNVTNHDTFVEAVNNPDDYPELLVRVSGYTAYFKDLNPQMQKEIIDRTEYLLSAKKSLLYDPFVLRQKSGERS